MPLIITTNTYDLVQMYACHRTLTKDKKGWARGNNCKEDDDYSTSRTETIGTTAT